MSNADCVGLTLSETLLGFASMGEQDPERGHARGRANGTALTLEVLIEVQSVARFIRLPEHLASLSGTVNFGPTGGARPITHGEFNVFTVDPETGHRQMVYQVRFTDPVGKRYCLFGQKRVWDDPGFDMISDLTTLFVTLHEGDDTDGPIVGAGQIFFELSSAPRMLASMTTTGADSFSESVGAKIAFLSFVAGKVRDVYLADINPLYDASYQNLVLTGELRGESSPVVPYFLASGVHDPGFPWGDAECFSDVMLIVGDEITGLRRFGLTRRCIDGLVVDVVEGRFRFKGELVELVDRSRLTFSEVSQRDNLLPKVHIDLEVTFTSKRHALAPFPFRIRSEFLDKLATRLQDTLRKILPSEALFGFHIVPHVVTHATGRLRIESGSEVNEYTLVPETSFGEAEQTTIRNVREPTLLYGYFCSPVAERRQCRVQFHASSLRNERNDWAKDRLDAWLGALISHHCSKQIVLDEHGISVNDLAEPEGRDTAERPLRRIGPPLLELSNDHFPTAEFQRRIVVVEDEGGRRSLALEEAMETLRCDAIGCEREVVVAAIRHSNKIAALETALDTAGLDLALDEKCSSLGKPREALRIVIKPNFMFTYDRLDRTTYTDPELVEALVARLQTAGYRKIQIVEAQSTYGEYFTNREVRSVAAYLGYTTDGSRGYEIVDLTEDARESIYFGPHLGEHPVPHTWRDADFRISFAKNKTHSYAFYTLTLKNVYGALCLPNKFREYHVHRDIYRTTIEYLKAYPVDFGIIDAHVSADGPFGIFADTEPNLTETILAGSDLVAVDWVGASKMGLDPRVSPYMRHAIAAFGKPRIAFRGDKSLYHPWLNVPHLVTLFAHCGIDATLHFGNLFYISAAHMDAEAFQLKPTSTLVDVTRAAMRPIRETAFLQADGHRTWANRLMSRLFLWLGR